MFQGRGRGGGEGGGGERGNVLADKTCTFMHFHI